MNLLHTLHTGFDSYHRLYIKHETPVIVMAPGRVGSIALNASLREAGVYSFKLEFKDKDPRGTAKFVQRHIFEKHRPAMIITLVRDPIAMMLTYYMSKANAGWLPEAKKCLDNEDVEGLRAHFITDVLQTERFTSHIDWFSNDFQTLTGIDVYKHQFDKDKQWSIIEDATYPTLIMRTELPDKVKSALVKDFLDLPEFTLTRLNTAATKPYKDIYEQFRQNLSLPQDVLDKVYSHPFCRHFINS